VGEEETGIERERGKKKDNVANESRGTYAQSDLFRRKIVIRLIFV
jgi:hypothetical protein